VDFNQKLQDFRVRIENAIDALVPLHPSTTPQRLKDAMNHSLQAGGKRIRPVLLLSTFEMNPVSGRDPMPAAVALECLHTYSLIHDDLPCMDDSDLRRGKPTCHIAFDEATAVLAGDALLTLAFELLSTAYAKDAVIANHLVSELAYAAGASRLVGGQMLDIQLEREAGKTVGIREVFETEDNKTGALFCASLRMGLLLSGADAAQLEIARELGLVMGRVFQIVDDILDAVGDEATVGKSLKADDANQKITAVTHYGVEGARREVDLLHRKAVQYCEQLHGDTNFLQSLLHYLKNRAY